MVMTTAILDESVGGFDIMGASVAAYEQRRSSLMIFQPMTAGGGARGGIEHSGRIRRVSLRGGIRKGGGRQMVMAGRITWE